jgi:hypothetical protein
MFVDAPAIFNYAKKAYESIDEKYSDRDVGGHNALASIILSVVSLEAFINETIELAENSQNAPWAETEPSSIASFATILSEAENSRGSILLKFLLARQVFAGQQYDKGSQAHQDFTLLIELRNKIVHLKPLDKVEFDYSKNPQATIKPPSIIEKLKSKNITAEINTSWINLVSTRAAARWACNTAANMVQSIIKVIPKSQFKEILQESYGQWFTPI